MATVPTHITYQPGRIPDLIIFGQTSWIMALLGTKRLNSFKRIQELSPWTSVHWLPTIRSKSCWSSYLGGEGHSFTHSFNFHWAWQQTFNSSWSWIRVLSTPVFATSLFRVFTVVMTGHPWLSFHGWVPTRLMRKMIALGAWDRFRFRFRNIYLYSSYM